MHKQCGEMMKQGFMKKSVHTLVTETIEIARMEN